MKALWAVLLSLAMASVAHGAGAMGHNALGTVTINRILSGQYAAPPELKEALSDPKVRQAFLGGSVGPDLFPTRTHRGNQSQFSEKMLEAAWKQYRAAGEDPAAREKASESLAFAYGWLSHVAVDLNIHPKVNEFVGDTYDYNDAGGKTAHAAMEAQLYAYLKNVVGIKDPFDARFPTDFVAEQLGVEPGELKRAISRIRIIAAGEIAAANQVKLSGTQLLDKWGKSVSQGLNDTRDFIEKPARFENWDLDCGKISTEDFEWLHKAVKELNGGKRPPDWGGRYMEFWNAVKDLPPGDRAAKLAEYLGLGSGSSTRATGVTGTAKFLAGQPMNVIVKVERDYVFPSRMRYPDSAIRWDGNKFSLSAKFEEYPFEKDFKVEGEIGEGEVVWVKLTCTQTMPTNPGFIDENVLEARHLPIIDGGLWDEYVGDVTFAAFTQRQAPGFTGSFKTGAGKQYRTSVWDQTTLPELSKNRTLYPILTVRFRLKKYG